MNEKELQYHIHMEISNLVRVAREHAVLENKESMDVLKDCLYRLGKLQMQYMDLLDKEAWDSEE